MLKKWIWLTVFVVILDQVTKIWASAALEMFQPHAFIPMLNFTLMHNEGAAFSFLSSAGGWQRWFFTALAVVVSVFIVIWMKRLPEDDHVQAAGLAFILGGALGNVIDRMMHGYVVDFIDFYYTAESCMIGFVSTRGECHWPAFNIADSSIFVGAALLILVSFRKEEKSAEAEK